MKYIDKQQWAWWVDGIEGIPVEYGIFMGPPDLSALFLDEETHLKLREALVDAQIYNASTLIGNRAKVFAILNTLRLPKETIKGITGIYQIDYYGEK